MNNSVANASVDGVHLRMLNAVTFDARGQNGQLLTLAVVICLLIVSIAMARSF
ncbi:hypothetical protein [Rudanella lutea]|uniref:hypothetical protein n=1 Tax=Rudanella lutea TaxID=451374 RepID=UPI0012F88762|nr:hypothetical protein [Rudanella lutea]